MSWHDDFYDGTYMVTRSNYGNASHVYYDKKFLEMVTKKLRMVPLGQPRPLPKYSGATIEFFRYTNISADVSAATLTEGINPDATLFTAQKLQKSLAEYGAFGQVSSLLRRTGIDPEVRGAVEVFAEHARRIMDQLAHREVAANGGYPFRADEGSSDSFTGAVDSATSTTIVDATLITNTDYGDANDDLNQSVVIITSGTGYGQARAVTDYVQASGTITVSPAWDVTPAAADTFVVAACDGILDSDKLTWDNIKRAVAILQNNEATPADGGYFIGVADPFVLEGIMDDSKWTGVHTYHDAAQGIFTGEVGKFAGVRWIMETQPFACPITTRGTAGTSYGPGANGGNYSATGTAKLVPILGRNAFGVTKLTGGDRGSAAQPMVRIKTPGKNTTSDPLDRYSTVGWVIEAAYKALNPMFCVNIITGDQT